MAVFQSFAFEQDLGARQEVDYLVVGGGASGGNNYGGGGGAGGYRSGSFTLVTNQAYAIIVGDGGFNVGGTDTGISGATSKFFGIESAGGGAGGFTAFTTLNTARNGGSGGGGGGARQGTNNRGLGNTPSTSPAQGQNGGNGGTQASNGPGGGGGGALNVGGTGPDNTASVGGVGGSGSLWLDGVRYAGGGGGASNTATVGALGGPGGGGRGSATGVASQTGSKNLGGGGGSNSQRGGSGIVKFRYSGNPKPELKGGSITTAGGFTTHEFTSSNFLYYNAQEQEDYDSAWTPSQFSGSKYWWRADLGVVTSSNNVVSWTDQISSYTLGNPSSSAYPIYSSSVSILNNQPAISTNGTSQYLFTTGSPANLTGDCLILYVVNMVSASTGGTMFGVCDFTATPSFRLTQDMFGGAVRNVYNTGSASTVGKTFYIGSTGNNTISSSINHFSMHYLRSEGDLAASSGSISSLIFDYGMEVNRTTFSTASAFTIGATIVDKGGAVASSRYVKQNIAEMLVVYAKPSDNDLVRWKNYVKKRYNTDLT